MTKGMEPVAFEECNINLVGEGCTDLPALKTCDGDFVSKWKVSFSTRIKILFQGHVWLCIKGQYHPPVFIQTEKPFMKGYNI